MNTSFDQAAESSQTREHPEGFVRAEGRARKAGYWLSGAGVAVVLSAFLPWVSIEGEDASHPQGGGVLLLLVIAGLLGYFGIRVLQGRLSKAVTIALWVISAVDIVLSFAIFGAASKLNNEGGGIVSVSPAVGFYVGIGGLLAGVVGTVLAQTVRRRHTVGQQSRQGN